MGFVLLTARRSLLQLITLFFVIVLSAPCIAEFNKDSLVVIDAEGGRVEEYCLVPLYGKSFGSGNIDNHFYLKSPVAIRKGDDLSKKIREDSFFDLWIPGFGVFSLGSSDHWSRLVFLKRGYEPGLWTNDYRVIYPQQFVLKKGSSDEVLELLISKKDKTPIRELFHISTIDRTWEVVDQYSDADRELLKKCYYDNDWMAKPEDVTKPSILIVILYGFVLGVLIDWMVLKLFLGRFLGGRKDRGVVLVIVETAVMLIPAILIVAIPATLFLVSYVLQMLAPPPEYKEMVSDTLWISVVAGVGMSSLYRRKILNKQPKTSPE